ncbi:hypothetical protein ACQP1W_32710 [Spirillospora sp. CA-255316]
MFRSSGTARIRPRPGHPTRDAIWRWSGGPGYKTDAVEDSRFHKGKMINNTTIGDGPPYGEHAIVSSFVLDKDTGGECDACLRVPNLKWK